MSVNQSYTKFCLLLYGIKKYLNNETTTHNCRSLACMRTDTHTHTHTQIPTWGASANFSCLLQPQLHTRPSKSWLVAFVSCCNEQTPALTKVETLCVPLFSSVGPSRGAGRKSSARRRLSGYCTNACKEHRQTLSHTKKNTGTKLIPSILSWNQRNDLKTTFFNNLITPNNKKKRDAASFEKKQKKGFSHLPKKKAFSKLLPLHNNKKKKHSEQLWRIARATRAPQELQLHFTQRLSHRTWLRNQRLHSLRQDTEDLHCNRLSSNICRMIMYRLPVREYCVFNKKKMHV